MSSRNVVAIPGVATINSRYKNLGQSIRRPIKKFIVVSRRGRLSRIYHESARNYGVGVPFSGGTDDSKEIRYQGNANTNAVIKTGDDEKISYFRRRPGGVSFVTFRVPSVRNIIGMPERRHRHGIVDGFRKPLPERINISYAAGERTRGSVLSV